MAINTKDQENLNAVFDQHRARYGGVREDYFAFLYFQRKFGLNVEEVASQITFGGNDYGIDAYHIDRRAGNLYLFQFKWTESHQQFKQTMERLCKDGLARVFGQAHGQDARSNDVLQQLRNELHECRGVIERVYLNFVFKGDADAAENSEGIQARREQLEGCAHLANQFFGRDVEFIVQFVADRAPPPPPPPPPSFTVHIRAHSETVHGGHTMHVGFARLMDLRDIHRALGQRFLDRNIRAALREDNTPNRKLRDAFDRIVIKQSEEPSVFPFRHNGVTLAAHRVEVVGDALVLHGPRLLNGAQTVSTLGRFLDAQESNSLLKRNWERLEALEVLTKIVEAVPDSEFVTGVTIANNQQNPVAPWALRAMDLRQVDLADKFREDVRIFYSRQEGAFDNLSDEEREEMGIASLKDIRIKPLAMTFLAARGDLASMKELPSVFEDQKKYDATFKASYLSVDVRRIVLAYKVGLVMTPVLRHLRTKLPDYLHRAVKPSRNLVWALLIQALLNNSKIVEWVETYGTSLTREASFRDVLYTQINTRVAPTIRSLIDHPDYAKRVQDEKWDFLRTSDSYNRAMDIAESRFRWTKVNF